MTPDITRDDGAPGDAPTSRGRGDAAAQRRAVRASSRRVAPPSRPATAARDGLVHLHLPLVEHCARRFRNRGEPLRGPRPGRHHRADQVDRPVRLRARRRVLDVRDPDDHRRDQALLPRQGLGDPGAAPAAGAADADRHGDRGADPEPRPLPHAARAGRDHRLHGGGDHRGHRVQQRLLDAVPGRQRRHRRRRPPACSTRSASTTRASSTSRSASRSSRCSTGSTPREKRILLLRFFKNMTQSQIAEEIGVSQMHVSRLLTRTLGELREPRCRGASTTELGLASGPAASLGECVDAGCGCSNPASTTSGHHGEATATQVVSPPRKLHATPSWMSWASTTGLRAQDCPRVSCQAQTSRPAPYPRRRPRWSAPIVDPVRRTRLAQLERRAQQHEHQALDGDQRGGHHERRRVVSWHARAGSPSRQRLRCDECDHGEGVVSRSNSCQSGVRS